MVTIKQIAAEAGVSVMTVSNVVHNRLSKVSPATVERVQAIIDKYHYVPNMAARSLITNASHIVALLLPLWHGTAGSLLFDPYVGRLTGMLETMLREKGYYVMLCSFSTEEQALTVQRTWRIDGSVLVLPHKDEITRALIRSSASPLVVMDRQYDDLPSLSVVVDDRKGGYLSARHLIERGHRRIGFASPSMRDSSVLQARYSGYLAALSEAGLSPNPAWRFEGYNGQEGGERVGRMIAGMDGRPSAVVATEDPIACGIIKGCQQKGMRLPEELSVVGFDDSAISRLIVPELTTVRQDIEQKARYAVEMLTEAIERREETPRRCVVMDVELVTRDSVAEA